MSRLPNSSVVPLALALGALLVAAPWNVLAADGDLDVAFNPVISTPAATIFQPYQDHVYFMDSEALPARLLRLRDDGSLDSSWSLPVRSSSFPTDFICLPAGGFAVLGFFGLDLAWADGSLSQVAPTDFATEGVLRSFVRRDGSVVQANSISGGLGQDVAQDREERLIVVGDFVRSRNEERRGLVRFHRSGLIDSGWNPAPALGIELENATNLTSWPYSVALGPDNSVVVAIRMKPEESESRDMLATLDENGAVKMTLLITNAMSRLQPVLQPDGRIIVSGGFTNWNGNEVTGIVRLNPNGTMDSTFKVTLGPNPHGSLAKPILDDAGRILLFGEFSSVNGTPRPGLARVFAYSPSQALPGITTTHSRARVATNDVLWINGEVSGFPPQKLHWYRNGEPLPGETNRALRWPVEASSDIGEFQLVAHNEAGTNQTQSIAAVLATRSPRPGDLDPEFNRPLPEFQLVTQLVPLPDGRILVASDSLDFWSGPQPVVGRLHADGTLDTTFGTGGLLRANRKATRVVPLPDGGVLVAGHFTEFESASASGLVALDVRGRRLPISFPPLDLPEVSSALRQPDGNYVIAGGFRQVGGQSAIGMARLLENGSLDPTFTSPLQPGQGVSDLVLDPQNRLLVAGNFIDESSGGPGAAGVGVIRTLPNGSLDPAFQRYPLGIGSLLLESAGTILAGIAPVRLAQNGEVLATFQRIEPRFNLNSPYRVSDRRSILFPDGSVISPIERERTAPSEYLRWRPDGQRDLSFHLVVPQSGSDGRQGPHVRAAALLADGSVLIATGKPSSVSASNWPDVSRLRRLPPDPGLSLTDVRVISGQLRATLATQPDVNYEIRNRSSLRAPASEPIYQSTGDGYLDEVAVPARDSEAFLELRRDDAPFQ